MKLADLLKLEQTDSKLFEVKLKEMEAEMNYTLDDYGFGELDRYYAGVYRCDAGSILAGSKLFAVHLPNGYGDGLFDVFIIDERSSIKIPDGYSFVTIVEGRFNIYDYDCLSKEERDNDDNILVQINGKYAVFCNQGDIIFKIICD